MVFVAFNSLSMISSNVNASYFKKIYNLAEIMYN